MGVRSLRKLRWIFVFVGSSLLAGVSPVRVGVRGPIAGWWLRLETGSELSVMSMAMRKWLWHKDRDACGNGYGEWPDAVIALP
jgi:hypothetical protein